MLQPGIAQEITFSVTQPLSAQAVGSGPCPSWPPR